LNNHSASVRVVTQVAVDSLVAELLRLLDDDYQIGGRYSSERVENVPGPEWPEEEW